MKNFILETNTPWQCAGEGVERQILGYDNSVMAVKVKFTKGAVGADHSHPHVQTSYIASGSFRVTINGKECILSQGDGFFVEPNALHGCVCIEDGVIIDVFAPMRQDFIG